MTADILYKCSEKKILVADDNPAILKTIFKYFSEANPAYEVLYAYNGAFAYQVASEELPDLIILDWDMPMLSGVEVITSLKKQEKTSEIPIIIITGVQIEDQNLEEALGKGAIDYIRKPFSRVELLARAKSALKLAELHQQQKNMMQSVIDAKNRELATIAIQVGQKNQILEDITQQLETITTKNAQIKKCLKTIQGNLNLDNQWEKFKMHFEQVHPHFFKSLQERYPRLTPNELKLCAYIRMNLSYKETMQILNISDKGLESARYRIKKKMSLSSENDLNRFIQRL